MIRIIFICLTILTIISCVASSGVLPFGPDTYIVTVESLDMGMSRVTKQAITEATNFCKSQDKYFLPKNTSREMENDFYSYSVIFMCLSENDPEYKRGEWEESPDTIIEDRRR